MNFIKPVLVAVSLALATTVAIAQETPAAPAQRSFKTHVLTRAQFDALAAKPASLLIIDVRRPDELTRIGGFPVFLNIQAADVEKSLEWIPKDRTIVTVSNHANRSGRVGDLLTAKGFNVAGTIGAQDYEAAGGTLTRIAPPAPRANAGAAAPQSSAAAR